MHSYRLYSNTVEFRRNCVQGTQTGKCDRRGEGGVTSSYHTDADRAHLYKRNGLINPIYSLALNHTLTATTKNWEDLPNYDEHGHTNLLEAAGERYVLSLFTLPTNQVFLRCTVHPI